MKILCVCDEGNNRSVHIASVLRYLGHETIPVGVKRISEDTRRMLTEWADLAVFTDHRQVASFPGVRALEVWPIPDVFRRPFNPEQHRMVREYARRLFVEHP